MCVLGHNVNLMLVLWTFSGAPLPLKVFTGASPHLHYTPALYQVVSTSQVRIHSCSLARPYSSYKPRAKLVASVWCGWRRCCGSYDGLQGTGNRDYCAVVTKGVSKRNPCWPGWRPVGWRGQCVYGCHRALESSMAQTDGQTLPISIGYCISILQQSESIIEMCEIHCIWIN